jgi:pimeloyl-ACP methyl ester carboxylesterase
VTIDGARILQLPGGAAQVFVEGPGPPRPVDRRGPGSRPIVAPPIVLIHCYSCSLHWWDGLAPLLAKRHRVIRIDLLGHGGSEKPSSGYEIPSQAALVAAALDRLNVQGAVVVGHSMGFAVATALAGQATQLVDRVVNINEGPSTDDDCSLPFIARLGYAPVIGETIWRVAPDFAIRDGYGDAFAPGYDLADGFPNPDQVFDDYNAMTFTSFNEAHDATDEFTTELSLAERMKRIPVPLLSIFGTEDQICDPESSQAAYETVPGARVAEIEGAGHSPNVEKPAETAALISEFAAEAGDEALSPPAAGGKRGGSSGSGGKAGKQPKAGSGQSK